MNDNKTITIRMPRALHASLKTSARSDGRSMASFLISLLKRYLASRKGSPNVLKD